MSITMNSSFLVSEPSGSKEKLEGPAGILSEIESNVSKCLNEYKGSFYCCENDFLIYSSNSKFFQKF